MRDTFYLVIGKTGASRMLKNKPELSPNEILVKIHLNIPNEAFERPIFTVDLSASAEDFDKKLLEYELELKKLSE